MPLLPAGMSEFLRRRAIEMIGVTLAVAGLLGFAALATYVPGDPSMNTSGDGPASNMLGLAGAKLSDLGLQTFGLGAVVLPLALLVWGWRLWSQFRITGLWIRLAATMAALAAVPAALALIAPGPRWPVEGGVGGWVGAFLGEQMVALVAPIGVGAWLALIVATLVALATIVLALGITRSELRVAIDTAWWAGCTSGALGATRLVARADQPAAVRQFRRRRTRDRNHQTGTAGTPGTGIAEPSGAAKTGRLGTSRGGGHRARRQA